MFGDSLESWLLHICLGLYLLLLTLLGKGCKEAFKDFLNFLCRIYFTLSLNWTNKLTEIQYILI